MSKVRDLEVNIDTNQGENKEIKKEREWANPIEFLMTCIGKLA